MLAMYADIAYHDTLTSDPASGTGLGLTLFLIFIAAMATVKER